MKRTITTVQNSNNANVKANLTLEGVVVAVTAISDTQINKQGKYWTALICDSNQNVNRVTKYLSSKTNCLLHTKMIEYLNNQNGIKLNKLKFSGDSMYTATNETIAAPKVVSFTPSCIQISTINNIESMSDGQYVSFMCKIIDIGPDDTILFNNGPKKVQKLKRTTIIADKTDSINMNLWENQFNLVEKNLSYKIKLAKVKIFNNDTSITTTIHTTFESIEDIGDTNCSDSVQLSYESTIIGIITSIGLVEESFNCPKCYSTDIDRNDKTIRCNSCKSRSLYSKQSMNQNQIKLNITDVKQNTFELIADPSKIKTLLQEYNREELSTEDLIEQESVLLLLSSITVHVNFNPINKHITNMVINNNEN